MNRIMHLPVLKLWRTVVVGLAVLFGLCAVVVWNWQVLLEREELDVQSRFTLDAEAISQRIQGRMRSYEMVLRGISSAFAGANIDVTPAQWHEIVDQIRVWNLYPGISSLVWARYVPAEKREEFLARSWREGRPDFRIFPAGERESYLPIEYIGPITDRTKAVIGLDIFTQIPQGDTIRAAIDSGEVLLSSPLSDLYTVTPGGSEGVGVLIYFPVYKTGIPPETVEERRAAFLGLTDAAFRGQELVEGIFGRQLRLFHISAHDAENENVLLFDGQDLQGEIVPPSWKPRFHSRIEIPIYGRTWILNVTGTPEYERSLIAGRSHDFSLILGLIVSGLLALLAGGFVFHRDQQLYISQQIAARLREKANQLMMANRYKSEFLANMSHELRTPLNSILILSDQLRQNSTNNLNEKQTRHADIIYRAGSDLLQLINDVLDLAKIESGRMQVTIEPLNLKDLLIDLDASMTPLAEAKGLHLHIQPITPMSGVPQRVHTDRVRVHQILLNLLSNAIKFTEHGQIHLMVSAGNRLKDGRVMLSFSVRDTGIGIDPSQHEQVFEAFAQLDGSTRRRFGGTGLGLAIVKQLVEALEGEITLQSALGQGSTFSVHLPMYVVQQSPEIDIVPPQRHGSGPTILIVEDDKDFAAVISEKARIHGFSTVHCATGQQALDLLRSEKYIAIILDILLPDVSGWQLFRALRSYEAHRHTPVHIISCLPQPSGLDVDQGTHYLTKPIGRDVLRELFTSLKHEPPLGPALLLVEDVDAERDYYRQRLSELGFAVVSCDSAKAACEAWEKNKFEVIVLDLNLPDDDGFTLLDSLDKLRPIENTRIVVNTGIDVTQDGLQRLHGYSAVVVPKRGTDTALLGQAVQGFLDQVAADNHVVGEALPDVPNSPPTPLPLIQVELKGRHVLLVDDDVRNVYAMSALLDDLGLEVSTASNGEEAIDAYNKGRPHVILMDMSMPVMDGYSATNILKKQHGCTIPIIAMTAHAMKGDREKCLAAGCDDYIAKPVKREDLRVLLARWLILPEAGDE